MDEKIGAGIVTYNPEIERLHQNIRSVIHQVEEIVIIDNASDNVGEIEAVANKHEKVLCMKNKCNFGMAKALNDLFAYYEAKQFGWVLTLDQDSICPKNMIVTYKRYLGGGLGILCPNVFDINIGSGITQGTENVYVKRCITSGSLTSVKAWRKIKGFDEKMFIDGVDFDFCDRLNQSGYQILKISSMEMKHEIGHMQEKRLFCFKVKVKNHSAFRKFYIAKNIVYLDRKNKCGSYPFSTVLREIKLILIVLFYEKEKMQKIKQIIRGIKAGFEESVNVTESNGRF